jgi:hypothetical protein
VQRYGCGGAILILPDGPNKDLNVKYKLNYSRLPETLVRFAVSAARGSYSGIKPTSRPRTVL